jgi:hypothetical protein
MPPRACGTRLSDHAGARKEGSYVAVSLPYTGGAFSALALLPEPGTDVAAALRDWAAAPQVGVLTIPLGWAIKRRRRMSCISGLDYARTC